MTMQSQLVAFLKADSGLTSLIDGRVTPIQRPLGEALPSLTYTKISVLPTKHRDSFRVTHQRTRIQFDLWGKTFSEVQNLRTIFFDAMSGFSNFTSGFRVDGNFLQDDKDILEVEPGVFRGVTDFYIWHTSD